MCSWVSKSGTGGNSSGEPGTRKNRRQMAPVGTETGTVVSSGIWQQSQKPCAFHGLLEHPLVAGAVSGTFAAEHPRLSGGEFAQAVNVLVIDLIYAFTAEAAPRARCSANSTSGSHSRKFPAVCVLKVENGPISPKNGTCKVAYSAIVVKRGRLVRSEDRQRVTGRR
jgi:hypothetical protein